MCKFFMLAGTITVVINSSSNSSNGFTNFLFYNGPYAEFIYCEMTGNCSCRPQSMVHVKQFNFFL